jgi:two-component system, OmpR family, KDP operon response regulator KdpE
VLRALLESHHFRFIEAENAQRALAEARGHKPDLMLIDLGLPDGDGLAVIAEVRRWSPVPIIVLSARALEEQIIEALDAGADDYVTKPFSAPELLARVRAALRRNVRSTELVQRLKLGELEVDLARRTAHTPSSEVHLTPLEYRVLEALARHAGFIVMQKQLLREVWGPTHVGDTRSLRVCIRNLRAKLEPEPSRPRYLLTEPGLGYRLRPEEFTDEPSSRPG